VRSVLRAIMAAFIRETSLPPGVVPEAENSTLAQTRCQGFILVLSDLASCSACVWI